MRYRYKTQGDPNCRQYCPTDPEFAALAAQITPLGRIPAPFPPSCNCWGDEGPMPMRCKHETPDSLTNK